jgi:hypothetical protein
MYFTERAKLKKSGTIETVALYGYPVSTAVTLPPDGTSQGMHASGAKSKSSTLSVSYAKMEEVICLLSLSFIQRADSAWRQSRTQTLDS